MLKTPIDLVNNAKRDITEVDECLNLQDYSLVLDVREPSEFTKGAIPGAINIPRGLVEFEIFAIRNVLDAAEKAAQLPILLYCKSGARSALAAQSLQELGFENVASLSGGYEQWSKKNI